MDAEAPTAEAWDQICRRAEGASGPELDQLNDRLGTWPDRMRPMPDRWWAEWLAAPRPWHALATHRQLARLTESHATNLVAGPDDLRLVLVGEGQTSNSDPGNVLLLAPLTETASLDDDEDIYFEIDDLTKARVAGQEAVDAFFSPDGSRVTIGFVDAEGPASYRLDGQELYQFKVDGGDGAEPPGTDYPAFHQVAQSRDGRMIVAGCEADDAITVADAETGEVLLRAFGARGPAALDGRGETVAYALHDGRIAIRQVVSGDLLTIRESGLGTVNALAFAPDDVRLVTAGAVDESIPVIALLTAEDHQVVPATDGSIAIDAELPVAMFATRVSWAEEPTAFFADDQSAVLVDGAGRVRWRSTHEQTAGGFTPGGRILIAFGPQGAVDAWFLDSLTGTA